MFGFQADVNSETVFQWGGTASRLLNRSGSSATAAVTVAAVAANFDEPFIRPHSPVRTIAGARPGARALDLCVGGLALLFFAPLMVAVAAAVWITGGGPILFRQRRVGLGGVRFDCFKFRTMRPDAEAILARVLAIDPIARADWARSQKLRNDPRISRLGHFMRKTSLDELPQLWNVLKGDMSIVGPRPIISEEISRYGRYFSHYAAVRPGLTGVWQINGRNNTSYRRRIACDVSYSRRRSVLGDISIIAKTVPVVLFAQGAY